MRVLNITNPISTFGRVMKYHTKGFNMEESDVIDFISLLRGFDLNKFKHANNDYAKFLQNQLWRD